MIRLLALLPGSVRRALSAAGDRLRAARDDFRVRRLMRAVVSAPAAQPEADLDAEEQAIREGDTQTRSLSHFARALHRCPGCEQARAGRPT